LSLADKLAVLPHSFVYFPIPIHQFSPARPLAVDPIAKVIVAIRIDVPTIAMIDIILKLTFVDDVVNLLSNALNAAIWTNLTYDELVVAALAKVEALVDWLGRVGYDVL